MGQIQKYSQTLTTHLTNIYSFPLTALQRKIVRLFTVKKETKKGILIYT